MKNLIATVALMDECGAAPDWLRDYDWEHYNHNVLSDAEIARLEGAFAAFFATRTMRELYEQALEAPDPARAVQRRARDPRARPAPRAGAVRDRRAARARRVARAARFLREDRGSRDPDPPPRAAARRARSRGIRELERRGGPRPQTRAHAAARPDLRGRERARARLRRRGPGRHALFRRARRARDPDRVGEGARLPAHPLDDARQPARPRRLADVPPAQPGQGELVGQPARGRGHRARAAARARVGRRRVGELRAGPDGALGARRRVAAPREARARVRLRVSVRADRRAALVSGIRRPGLRDLGLQPPDRLARPRGDRPRGTRSPTRSRRASSRSRSRRRCSSAGAPASAARSTSPRSRPRCTACPR